MNANVIDGCMKLLGVDMSELLDLTMKEGIKRRKSGPDITTLNRAFRRGYATPWVYSLILHAMQEKYLEGYSVGKFTREEASMILDLNVWPSRRMRDEYYRGLRGHRSQGRSTRKARTMPKKEKKTRQKQQFGLDKPV